MLNHPSPLYPITPSIRTTTELASNVLKPSLDILIYARRLQTSVRTCI